MPTASMLPGGGPTDMGDVPALHVSQNSNYDDITFTTIDFKMCLLIDYH